MSTIAPPRAQAAPPAPSAPLEIPADRLYRLSIAQVDALGKAGLVEGLDRLELIEGLLVKKMAKNPPHIAVSSTLARILYRAVPEEWSVCHEAPVVIEGQGLESMPEPDFLILRGDLRMLGRRPLPHEVVIAIEVSDTSLHDDTTWKKALYARAGVPTYWVINIPARRIEVYTEPTGPADVPDYRARRIFAEAEEVPLTIDGREVVRIILRELLPSAS
jgi:Uma2 family endonuclease